MTDFENAEPQSVVQLSSSTVVHSSHATHLFITRVESTDTDLPGQATPGACLIRSVENKQTYIHITYILI